MASELKQDEEGMAEILQTNETVIRVMDRYKSIFGEPTTNGTSTTSSTTTATTTTTASGTPSSGAVASGAEGGVAAGGGASASKQDDVLIDLLDLDLGPPATIVGGGANLSSGSGTSVGGGSGSGTNLGSLLDDLGSLGTIKYNIHRCHTNSIIYMYVTRHIFYITCTCTCMYGLIIIITVLSICTNV